MKNDTIWLALGVLAVGAVGYYVTKGKSKVNTDKNSKSGEVVATEMSQAQKNKFCPALLREYDLIVPPFRATASAERIAQEITDKRYEIDPIKVKQPVYL
jgi:hypothetical protein